MLKSFPLLLCLILTYNTSQLLAQKVKPPESWMSKTDYYNEVLAPARGYEPLDLSKISIFADRKRSIMDLGQLVLRFSNAATLGYDRWGFNHEYPSGSNITYYWTMAPMVGALKRKDGKLSPTVAIGTRGAARDSEEEFEPLGRAGGQLEFDSGVVDVTQNIGIAFSDKPESWPDKWPIELDPTGSYTDLETNLSFPGIEFGLDMDDPEGNGLRFPGVINGKVVAEREAYFVVTDNDPLEGNIASSNNGVGPLDIRIDVWVLQFSDILNQDFITFRQIVTNVGSDTLFEVYVGIHGDPDCPEQGGAEWTDDYALFFPPNDSLMEEKIGVNDSLLWNLGIVWDGDDKAEGFLSSGVGWIGLKVLETPIDPETGKERGLTTFNVFAYADAPQDDNGAYLQLKSGIQPPWNVTPNKFDREQKPYSYGPDITWVLASGPFTLAPGESLPFSYASILGVNEKDLLANARLAQLLYSADYKAASPPEEPVVRAVAGDKKVTLYWDAFPSEYSTDPLTGSSDKFAGYRVYKSTDRGRTWGKGITDINAVVQNYVPVAIYDKIDGITGTTLSNPYLDLGSDSGIKYKFVDTDVINGFEYWYAVSAYDSQDGEEVPPMENSRKRNAYLEGDNTVAVVPKSPVAGYTMPDKITSEITPRPIDEGTGTINFDVLDQDNVSDANYDIVFYDTLTAVDTSNGMLVISELTGDLYYSLRNLTKSQDSPISYIADTTIAGVMTKGEQIFIEETHFMNYLETTNPAQLLFPKNSGFFSSDNPQVYAIKNSDEQDGVPPFEGIRVSVEDNKNLDFSKPGRPLPTFRDFEVLVSSGDPDLIYTSGLNFSPSSTPLPADYKVVFRDSSSKYDQLLTAAKVPFQIFNLDKDPNKAILLIVSNLTAEWKSGDVITFIEPDGRNFTWSFSFKWSETDTDSIEIIDDNGISTFKLFDKPQFGDEILLRTNKPFRNGEVYSFSTEGPTLENNDEKLLSGVKVVPNPFTVTSIYETSIEVKEVQFTHLPPEAIIRIYNIAGELVQTIRHENGTSIEPWNLRTYNDQDISFGIYIFHVTAPGGQVQMGKMAVIR